jgi:hypothetical protein
MADERISAVNHGVLSRAGHAAGQASGSAFSWGTLGLVGGALLGGTILLGIPALIAWGTFTGLTTLLGGAAAAGPLVPGFVAAITGLSSALLLGTAASTALIGTTLVGTIFGAYRGASNSADKTGREQAAFEFEASKAARLAENRAQFAAMMMPPQPQPTMMMPPEMMGIPAGYGAMPAPADAMTRMASSPLAAEQFPMAQSSIVAEAPYGNSNPHGTAHPGHKDRPPHGTTPPNPMLNTDLQMLAQEPQGEEKRQPQPVDMGKPEPKPAPNPFIQSEINLASAPALAAGEKKKKMNKPKETTSLSLEMPQMPGNQIMAASIAEHAKMTSPELSAAKG